MAQPMRKESPPRSVGHESIDGTLSGSVLQFNLATELDQLHRDEAWLHPTGRSPDLRIVLIAMKANTRMHEHTAAGRISVHTLNGHIRPSPAGAGGGSPCRAPARSGSVRIS